MRAHGKLLHVLLELLFATRVASVVWCGVQVYQAIRSCRGLAPVFIPGASELEKLVASAEAWASKACEILKIKVGSYSRVLRPARRYVMHRCQNGVSPFRRAPAEECVYLRGVAWECRLTFCHCTCVVSCDMQSTLCIGLYPSFNHGRARNRARAFSRHPNGFCTIGV